MDLFRYLHPSLFPEEKIVNYLNMYLYIGGKDTGTALHMDTLSTSAFNVVWSGAKKWWFIMSRDEELESQIMILSKSLTKHVASKVTAEFIQRNHVD